MSNRCRAASSPRAARSISSSVSGWSSPIIGSPPKILTPAPARVDTQERPGFGFPGSALARLEGEQFVLEHVLPHLGAHPQARLVIEPEMDPPRHPAGRRLRGGLIEAA